MGKWMESGVGGVMDEGMDSHTAIENNCLIFPSVRHCLVNELTSLTSLAERPGLSRPDERVRAESAHC